MNKRTSALINYRLWLIISFCGIFYCYQFILRVLTNTLSQEFIRDFQIDASEFGIVIASYSFAYAITQIPFGILLDVVKVRNLLPIAPIICAIGAFMLSCSTEVTLAIFSRFLIGLGSAFGFIGAVKVATLILPSRQISIAIGIIILFGTLGAGIGGTPLKELTSLYSWREITRMLAFIGIIISMLLYITLSSKIVRISQDRTFLERNFILKDIKKIFINPQLRILALYGMLTYLPITVLGVGWGKDFIIVFFNTAYNIAANAIFLMFIGAGIGSLIIPLISEIINKRKWVMLVTSCMSFCVYIFLLYVPMEKNVNFIYGVFFTIGGLYAAKTLSFAIACEIMPKSISALTTSLLNMFAMAAGVFFHPAIGYLLKDGCTENLVSYTEGGYKIAFSVLPISALISFLLVLFILGPVERERYNEQ